MTLLVLDLAVLKKGFSELRILAKKIPPATVVDTCTDHYIETFFGNAFRQISGQRERQVRYSNTEPSTAAIPMDQKVSTQDHEVIPPPVMSSIKPATTDPRDAAANPPRD
jgi:hypothetical protein